MALEWKEAKGKDAFCSDSIKQGIFYKTAYTMAVCDRAPVIYGHSLVIPVRHVTDLTELSEEEFLDFFSMVKKVKPAILRLYGDSSNSYDMTAQMGKYSGMSVPHLHFHIIPRKKDDKYQGEENVYAAIEHSRWLSDEEYEKRVVALRKELKWDE